MIGIRASGDVLTGRNAAKDKANKRHAAPHPHGSGGRAADHGHVEALRQLLVTGHGERFGYAILIVPTALAFAALIDMRLCGLVVGLTLAMVGLVRAR